MANRQVPQRKDGRLIIHFDYDCFYAAVFEAKNPGLKSLPFAVQQKQIIVTCNYEARRRGLYKLMLIKEAKRVCPEVIIELGEDITRFRDASKELYKFIESHTWNGRVEKLGFDEVWMDVTDMVDYNMEVLNRSDLGNAFFQMSKDDPEQGFAFDATAIAGHAYPPNYSAPEELDELTLRLRLASHLAVHMRKRLEELKGYTSTVGIATNKLISKLVGNLNKPNGQTTLMPPLQSDDHSSNNAIRFMDEHEVGKVPGIGFKMSQVLRAHILKRPAAFDPGLVYGGTLEKIMVSQLRCDPEVNPEMLEKLLAGPGAPHGIGYRIWCLIHGVDDTDVSEMRRVPRQISIEDSYIRLDTMPEVISELTILARSLLIRMRVDLLGRDEDAEDADEDIDLTNAEVVAGKKWLAHPKTLRLTTRPRQPLQADGTRQRSFKRISHSGPLPTFVFKLSESIDAHTEKLVHETLLGMFRKLHPQDKGWNLSLVNLAVTNMMETAGDSKSANGRDIGHMFKRQDDVLKDFRVTETDDDVESVVSGDEQPDADVEQSKSGLSRDSAYEHDRSGLMPEQSNGWESDDEDKEDAAACKICGMSLPTFAMSAHQRFHIMNTNAS